MTDAGYFICPFCNGMMVWSNTEDASEILDCDYEEDDTAMVNYFRCSRCGRDFEIVDPPRAEREDEYKDYWNE